MLISFSGIMAVVEPGTSPAKIVPWGMSMNEHFRLRPAKFRIELALRLKVRVWFELGRKHHASWSATECFGCSCATA
uniref:Uncharacterized protein n=1 Tax=Tetranychus urticae TaxID=32264 RepID=T1JWB5_TETUR